MAAAMEAVCERRATTACVIWLVALGGEAWRDWTSDASDAMWARRVAMSSDTSRWFPSTLAAMDPMVESRRRTAALSSFAVEAFLGEADFVPEEEATAFSLPLPFRLGVGVGDAGGSPGSEGLMVNESMVDSSEMRVAELAVLRSVAWRVSGRLACPAAARVTTEATFGDSWVRAGTGGGAAGGVDAEVIGMSSVASTRFTMSSREVTWGRSSAGLDIGGSGTSLGSGRCRRRARGGLLRL
ncbi:hypothetical protein BJ912DRAFT_997645 [Pholiota molesta]|nr:hypothetical protein BJ912DRAFT_997645 [Pholiota molesta]